MELEFEWDKEKNEKLKQERGVSFEEVVEKIQKGDFVDKYPHPNVNRYPHQQIYVVILRNYAFYVPYVQNANKCFLKTIIASRKATKKYVRKENI